MRESGSANSVELTRTKESLDEQWPYDQGIQAIDIGPFYHPSFLFCSLITFTLFELVLLAVYFYDVTVVFLLLWLRL